MNGDDDIVADEELTGASFTAGNPGLPKDVQVISYFEESTDGNVIDSDLLRQSSDNERSSDDGCDIDELADDPLKSPELKAMKKPTNEVLKKMRHNCNLSDVLEENSCSMS